MPDLKPSSSLEEVFRRTVDLPLRRKIGLRRAVLDRFLTQCSGLINFTNIA
jgi:hypothetical protein